jgi:hypothetical protein
VTGSILAESGRIRAHRTTVESKHGLRLKWNRHYTKRCQNYECDEVEDILKNVSERELGGCAGEHGFAAVGSSLSHKEAQKTIKADLCRGGDEATP